MITTFYPPYHFGGDGNYVRMLAHILVGMGHTVDIIHDIDAYRVLSTNPNPEPIDEPDGLTVHRLRSAVPAISCLATQQFGRPLVHGKRIRKILDAGNYDVIHYHNISLVGGPGILGYGTNAVKLYTAHEHWLVCPTHILWRNKREVCTSKKCIGCLIRYRRPPQLWRYTGLLDKMSQHVDAFCSPSEFSAIKHGEFGFGPKMRVTPSFLPDAPPDNSSSTDNTSEAVLHDRPYFLFVGRLEHIKGVQDVIPAFLKDAAADLLIVGSGNYEADLTRMAGDSNAIHFLGWKKPEEIKSLYKQAIAVVIPSICYEVFPLVLLEAFREGTPVIARDIGPLPELVRKSGAGLLFDSEQQLIEMVNRIAGNKELRDEMAQAALTAYERYWSQSKAMKDYFKLIKSIAEDRGMASLADAIPA